MKNKLKYKLNKTESFIFKEIKIMLYYKINNIIRIQRDIYIPLPYDIYNYKHFINYYKIDFSRIKINKYFLERHINKFTNKTWKELSNNNNLPLDFIEKYINKPWNFQSISFNNNLTLKFIEKHINKNWNFDYLKNTHKLTTTTFTSKNIFNTFINFFTNIANTIYKFFNCKIKNIA